MPAPANESVLKFMRIFLELLGAASQPSQNDRPRRVFFRYYLMAAFFTLTGFQILLLFHIERLYELIMTLIYVFMGIYYNVASFLAYARRDRLVEMAAIIGNGFYKYREPTLYRGSDECSTSDRAFRKFAKKFSLTLLPIHALVTIPPFIVSLIASADISSPTSMMVPSWYPFTIDAYFKYVMVIGYQFTCIGSLSAPLFANILYLCYFVIEIRLQARKLQFALNSIDLIRYRRFCERAGNEDRSERRSLPTSDFCEDKAYRCLVECIQHHQLIIRFENEFVSFYKIAFLWNLMYSSVNTSLICFAAVSVDDGALSAYPQLACSFVMVVSYLFLFCFIGEVLQKMRNELQHTLYGLSWFEGGSARFDRTLLIMLSHVQILKPKLKIGVTYIASYALFASILRMSYTYFNFLLRALN